MNSDSYTLGNDSIISSNIDIYCYTDLGYFTSFSLSRALFSSSIIAYYFKNASLNSAQLLGSAFNYARRSSHLLAYPFINAIAIVNIRLFSTSIFSFNPTAA